MRPATSSNGLSPLLDDDELPPVGADSTRFAPVELVLVAGTGVDGTTAALEPAAPELAALERTTVVLGLWRAATAATVGATAEVGRTDGWWAGAEVTAAFTTTVACMSGWTEQM
jgi:hypothetical protein